MARTYTRRTHLRKRMPQRQTTTSFPVLPLLFGLAALVVMVWMLMHPRW